MIDPLAGNYMTRIWILSFATGAACVAAMAPLLRDLRPRIVYLEIANRVETVEAIIASWSKRQQRHARSSLPIDTVFAISYSAFLATTCLLLGSWRFHTPRFFAAAGWPIAMLAVVAGLGDIIENAGLALELGGNRAKTLIRITSTASWIKWILVAAVLLYVVAVALWIEIAWLVCLVIRSWHALFRL